MAINKKHQSTLRRIFQDPIRSNIEWKEIEKLLIALGAEISEGIVVDYDEQDQMVGIDIDNTKSKLDLKELILNELPIRTQKHTAETNFQA